MRWTMVMSLMMMKRISTKRNIRLRIRKKKEMKGKKENLKCQSHLKKSLSPKCSRRERLVESVWMLWWAKRLKTINSFTWDCLEGRRNRGWILEMRNLVRMTMRVLQGVIRLTRILKRSQTRNNLKKTRIRKYKMSRTSILRLKKQLWKKIGDPKSKSSLQSCRKKLRKTRQMNVNVNLQRWSTTR